MGDNRGQVQNGGVFTRMGRWGDRQLLRSVPEYHLFESEQSRHKAIEELDKDVSDSRGFVRAMLVIWVLAVITGNLSFCAVPMLAPRALKGYGMLAAALVFVVAVAITLWVWRRAIGRRLRKKLIETGVPVCRECGYRLRGLPAGDSIRCPECGWEADEFVRGLVARAS